ncbi:hypothetical protein HYX17_00615 [Candidatus Woesearchaeota archaeon]|nr:hypothetical protein [Candidatus Woesearchaeota archaeon]
MISRIEVNGRPLEKRIRVAKTVSGVLFSLVGLYTLSENYLVGSMALAGGLFLIKNGHRNYHEVNLIRKLVVNDKFKLYNIIDRINYANKTRKYGI